MDTPADIEAGKKTLDLILSTVSDFHDATSYVDLLANSGTLVNLGLVTEPHSVKQASGTTHALSPHACNPMRSRPMRSRPVRLTP